MWKRILASCIIFGSIMFLPFWVSATLTLAGIILFPYFFEGVMLMLLVDILYGVPVERFYGFIFVDFSISLVVLGIVEYIKQITRLKK